MGHYDCSYEFDAQVQEKALKKTYQKEIENRLKKMDSGQLLIVNKICKNIDKIEGMANFVKNLFEG